MSEKEQVIAVLAAGIFCITSKDWEWRLVGAIAMALIACQALEDMGVIHMRTKPLTADEIAQIAVAEWMVGAISFEEAVQRIRNAEDET